MTIETARQLKTPERPGIVLGPEDEGRLLTAEEFATAKFLNSHLYERVCARLVVMPPDGEDHFATTEPWMEGLTVYRHFHREIVRRVAPNAWVRIDADTDRIGDLAVYLVSDESPQPIPNAVPDLMFEVVSPSKADRERDYVQKKAEYHRLGIREYVVIDRFRKMVTVFIHEPEGYAERVLGQDDIYESPLLPGFALPVADAFRDL